MALRALHLSATRLLFLDFDSTFKVRAVLSTELEEQVVQSLLSLFVFDGKVFFVIICNKIEDVKSVY